MADGRETDRFSPTGGRAPPGRPNPDWNAEFDVQEEGAKSASAKRLTPQQSEFVQHLRRSGLA